MLEKISKGFDPANQFSWTFELPSQKLEGKFYAASHFGPLLSGVSQGSVKTSSGGTVPESPNSTLVFTDAQQCIVAGYVGVGAPCSVRQRYMYDLKGDVEGTVIYSFQLAAFGTTQRSYLCLTVEDTPWSIFVLVIRKYPAEPFRTGDVVPLRTEWTLWDPESARKAQILAGMRSRLEPEEAGFSNSLTLEDLEAIEEFTPELSAEVREYREAIKDAKAESDDGRNPKAGHGL